jgi:hypothetical protein
MRCPVCSEPVGKASTLESGDLLVRCRTDGDFVITPAVLKKMKDLPGDARQQALNRAILAAQPGVTPLIRKWLIAVKREGRVSRPS